MHLDSEVEVSALPDGDVTDPFLVRGKDCIALDINVSDRRVHRHRGNGVGRLFKCEKVDKFQTMAAYERKTLITPNKIQFEGTEQKC